MPYFTAKKRCFYNGVMHEKGAVTEFFESVSAESWEPMDEEGHELLVFPEGSEEKPELVTVSGDEFAELQGLYNAAVADLDVERESVQKLKVQLEELEDDFGVLKVESEHLASAAESATAMQVKVANLKKLVAGNENKSVLEEAIQNM